MSNFQLTILGCGSATPSLRHNPTCQVIDYRNKLLMIDCGEGTQLAMRRYKIKFSCLRHILISHLHGDHFFGLPGLLSTLALHEKGGALVIHIMKEGADYIKYTMDRFCKDTSYKIEYHILDPAGEKYEIEKGLMLTTFPLSHRVPCLGFRFDEMPKPRHINGEMAKFHEVPVWAMNSIKAGADYEKPDGTMIANRILTTEPDRSASYAYCSDTMYDPDIVPYIKGVDTLYHEATYAEDNAGKAASRGHSTAKQAAEIAKMADVKRLLIGHYSKSYTSDEIFEKEAREIFPNTEAVNEGMNFDLLK